MFELTTADAAQFSTGNGASTGNGPRTVAVGDLNQDGNPDLVTANVTSDDVAVLLGDGIGGFGPAISFTTGTNSQAHSVATGDLNGDGKFDLAVANTGTQNVSVLRGNGDGTFGRQTTYSTGTGGQPHSIAIADFNQDVRLDLIAANAGTKNVAVFLATGTEGSFGAATFYTVGTRPFNAAIADFNNDGKMDVVTANNRASNISVLLGNGNGTFQTHITATAGFRPSGVAVADFNLNGKLDVAVANAGVNNDGTASILLGNGDGTFQTQTVYDTGDYSFYVAAGDLDNDGDADIVTANIASSDVSVLLGDGSGGFGLQTKFTTAPQANSVVIADVNGDQKLDIITTNASANVVTVLYGAGDGWFDP